MGELVIDEVCNMHARGFSRGGRPAFPRAATPLLCMSRGLQAGIVVVQTYLHIDAATTKLLKARPCPRNDAPISHRLGAFLVLHALIVHTSSC